MEYRIYGIDKAIYNEFPVDIDTFMTDEQYLGKYLKDITIYPFWKDRLHELFGENRNIDGTIFAAARESGNTITCAIAFCYAVYNFLCLKDPNTLFNFAPKDRLEFVILSSSHNSVFFTIVKDMIYESSWFRRNVYDGLINVYYNDMDLLLKNVIGAYVPIKHIDKDAYNDIFSAYCRLKSRTNVGMLLIDSYNGADISYFTDRRCCCSCMNTIYGSLWDIINSDKCYNYFYIYKSDIKTESRVISEKDIDSYKYKSGVVIKVPEKYRCTEYMKDIVTFKFLDEFITRFVGLPLVDTYGKDCMFDVAVKWLMPALNGIIKRRDKNWYLSVKNDRFVKTTIVQEKIVSIDECDKNLPISYIDMIANDWIIIPNYKLIQKG